MLWWLSISHVKEWKKKCHRWWHLGLDATVVASELGCCNFQTQTHYKHTHIISYLVFRDLHCNRKIKASFGKDFHVHRCMFCLWIFYPCKYDASLNSLGWLLIEYGLIYLPLFELDMGFSYIIWFEHFYS